MGIIAPEHKKKKKNISPSPLLFFIIILVIILLPFNAVRSCTAKDPAVIRERIAGNGSVAEVDVSGSEDASGGPGTFGGAGDFSGAESIRGPQNSFSGSENIRGSSEINRTNGYYAGGSQRQVYTKDRNGLYNLTGPVMDTAGIISSSDYTMLTHYLLSLSEQTGVQIAVLTVKSLNGESIEEFGISHAEKWQLGQKGVDNGALLTVALNERDVRIDTGYGTEGVLTDAICSRIIRNVIIPEFRVGNYSTGIVEAVQNMAGVITSDESLVSESVSNADEADGIPVPVLIFMILFAIFYFSVIIHSVRKARKFGVVNPGAAFYTTPHHHSHSSFGGGGGHSSFSGGGGHFGGGGASGHW